MPSLTAGQCEGSLSAKRAEQSRHLMWDFQARSVEVFPFPLRFCGRGALEAFQAPP